MRRHIIAIISASALIAVIDPAAAAAPKPGAVCLKAGAKATSAGSTLVCTKTGKKQVWKKKASSPAVPAPTPTVTPVATPTTTPSPTTAPTASPTSSPTPTSSTPAVIDWGVPKSSDEIVSASIKAFDTWAAVSRSTVAISWGIAAETPADLAKWIRLGVPFMASRLPSFKAPNKLAVITAPDVDIYTKFVVEIYGEAAAIPERPLFTRMTEAGAPAVASNYTNVWELGNIARQNLMETDPVGMKQTPGHEFFHIFQKNAAKCFPCKGTPREVPTWFIEGAAMYMGLQSVRFLGYGDYVGELRADSVKRYGENRSTQALALKEVNSKSNQVDPYAIGFAATEFLVAKVGVERFLNIYLDLGTEISLNQAFLNQTGLSYEEFCAAFDAARAVLGFPRA